MEVVVLLIGFAFVAGAGTALSPCVLPVLPAVLTAGVTGGRGRPAGVITGLVITFTFAIVALVYVIDALGLPNDLLRTLAIVVLIGFGISLLVPPLSARIEAWASRFGAAPRISRKEGFRSGLVLGGSLGLLYAPCAGPVLAGVITVSAAQDFTVGRLAVAIAYALGSAVVLYALMAGGRRLSDRLAAYRGRIQVAMGAVMLAVAAVMVADLDLRFQRAVAEDLPAFLRSPAASLEETDTVTTELAALSGAHGAAEGGGREAERGEALPVLGGAPELTDTQEWFNTAGGRGLSLAELRERGRVVLIDFWTYTCINCIRTLPHLRAWDAEYRDHGLTVIGVHTPEFPFERDASNVEGAIDDYDLRYPVVQDNEFGTWDAFANRYWPAKYLIDANGRIRYAHFGEGEYETTERAIRSLLGEAGRGRLGERAHARAETADPRVSTPETYLGSERAQGFVNGPIPPGTHDFGGRTAGERVVERLPPNALAYRGRWRIEREFATALQGAAIDVNFGARRVFLVLGSRGEPRRIRVLLDGRPIANRLAGEDVRDGAVTVSGQRLYRLAELPRAERHVLTLEPERGTDGYAFTFG
ncbi:MAG: cytochrome c biogenesis protein DipZ [Solirubrobacterales bacterium]